ncbi:MAG: lantibiotic biosynthesis protein [Actinomycetota bacterium]|nr:lantibiotic biosynthesis protein [Actinomycetota bacterium]
MTFTNPGTPPPEQPPAPGWGQSLSAGAAGLALLHIGYAHGGLGDWVTAHRWVKTMAAEPVAAHPDVCLYRGSPAVAFVLRTAALPAYADVLHTLDEHIGTITRTRLEAAHERIDRGELPNLREFDLVNGLTGLGVCLLQAVHADPIHRNSELLRDVLSYLVRLTGRITVDGAKLPGWWTANGPSDRPDPQWPGGHANLGMAHGISGPLTLLSTAMAAGISVPRQADAIESTDWFLSSWRCGSVTSPWWPGAISAREWANVAVEQPGPQRPSWCYGTPGITRARYMVAQALDIPHGMFKAQAALVTCITDNTQLDQLGDDSLCHGWAGLVHTTRRILAGVEPCGEFAEALSRLEHRWRRRRSQTVQELSDLSGMLEGCTGIALTDLPSDIGWDACLLTAPPTAGLERPATTHAEGTG